MNTFLRDQLVRKLFSGGGGGGGGNREGEVTARMNRFVAQTETDSNNLINAVTNLGKELKKDAQDLSKDYLAGISGEEKQALDRLEKANNWLTDETNRMGSEFSSELKTALNDLETASRVLGLGEFDDVSAQIKSYSDQATALDTGFRSEVGGILDRMDSRVTKEVGDYREESLSLGDRFVRAAGVSMDEYRSLLGESGDLSPERLIKFTQAADFLSREAVNTRANMLAAADPRALELSAIADENAAANMSGRISADVQANLARSSAVRALQGGFGASSEMGRGLSARDLGLTSLDLQQQGMKNYQDQRVLNYNTRVAGLQADSGQLLANDQTRLERMGGSILESGLRIAESDRNQRQSIFDTALGARLAASDTRRVEEIGSARGLYDTAVNRSRDTLGMNLTNTGAYYNRERQMAGIRFDTSKALSSRLFETGVATAGTLYGTNVNSASNIYNTNVGSLGNVFGTRMQASATAISMRDVAQRQKLAALTQVRSSAAAMIEQAAEADYQTNLQNTSNNNAMWGQIIGAAGTVVGGAVGTAIAPGVGTMLGASLGGMAGGLAANSLGTGGSGGAAQGSNQAMSAVGAYAGGLGGRGASAGTTFNNLGAAQAAAPYASSFTNMGSSMGWVPRAVG